MSKVEIIDAPFPFISIFLNLFIQWSIHWAPIICLVLYKYYDYKINHYSSLSSGI